MSPQTAEALDRDGFTPAEQAYFASQGQNTEGLVDDASASDPVIPDPAVDPKPAADTAAVAAVDPVLDVDPDDGEPKNTTDSKTLNFRKLKSKFESQLKEEREARKTDQAELAKEREMRTRIDERLKLFNEVIAPQAGAVVEKPAMPNPEDDIFGAFKWLAEHSAAEIAELKGQIGQTAQTVHDTTAETQLRDTYQAAAQRFMGKPETSDFPAAYQHVNRVRDAMLAEIGYSDPNQRAQIRMDEERALVAQALQAGKDPAATIYGVAKSLGYVKAAPVAAAAAATPAVATSAAAAAPSVTEEVERIAKAQAASKSLSSGGGASVGPMTVETLANMTEGEFEAYARKNPNVVKELMGG